MAGELLDGFGGLNGILLICFNLVNPTFLFLLLLLQAWGPQRTMWYLNPFVLLLSFSLPEYRNGLSQTLLFLAASVVISFLFDVLALNIP